MGTQGPKLFLGLYCQCQLGARGPKLFPWLILSLSTGCTRTQTFPWLILPLSTGCTRTQTFPWLILPLSTGCTRTQTFPWLILPLSTAGTLIRLVQLIDTSIITRMGDSISITISDDSPLDETLNRGPLQCSCGNRRNPHQGLIQCNFPFHYSQNQKLYHIMDITEPQASYSVSKYNTTWGFY